MVALTLSTLIVSLVAAATIVIASVKFLTILLETSEGFDRIKNWPDGPWIDWVSESFYVISAAALCMTPGGLLYLLLAPRWEFAWTMFPLSAVLLFPVLLLSMLSAASPLAPLTATLLRMLVRMWWAWLLFFLQSTMAIVAAVAVTWGLVDRLDLLGVALACAIDVPLAMIYFRLLGRLALCCKQASVADIKRQAAAETS
ncbi:MAG: hypothetical protein IIA67_10245 [Planctomycetes bacterium]|nr:hypothetical protein [Planctomycetota bacterium]